MLRKIIRIDEQKCTGCEECLPNCPEGAIQMIDGKARLISDLFCDGLGACLGTCPERAITIEEREAQPYDERTVMLNIIKQGPNVIRAHLEHLREHNETEYLRQALAVIKEKFGHVPRGFSDEDTPQTAAGHHCACPGSANQVFASQSVSPGIDNLPKTSSPSASQPNQSSSSLRHWPLQLHLISPMAPQYRNADLLLSADCVPFALAGFHESYLKGRSLAIACPKLDEGQDVYLEKLTALIDGAQVNTMTVMTMQVPCCQGLLNLATTAAAQASRKIPVRSIVVGLRGEILRDG